MMNFKGTGLQLSDYLEQNNDLGQRKMNELKKAEESIRLTLSDKLEKGVISEELYQGAINQLDNLLQKGHKAAVGEIREWGDKKYKKQPNGKWMEVSESHRMTKKEHEDRKKEIVDKTSESYNRMSLTDRKNLNKVTDSHKEAASKLSDKEYSDEEVGFGKVIGHTKSGKPIYAGKMGQDETYRDYSHEDHFDAARVHEIEHKGVRNLNVKNIPNSKESESHKYVATVKRRGEGHKLYKT